MSTTEDGNPTPVLPPPPNHTSNFDNPKTLMPAVVAATIVVHIVTFLFVSARVTVNALLTRPQLPDYLCYTAYLAFIAWTGIGVYAEKNGAARHMWDITPQTLADTMRNLNTLFIVFPIAVGFAKTSVLLQIKRIFTTKQKGVVYWVIWGSIVANVLFYFILFFLYIFTCWPREKIWKTTIPGKCMDSIKLNLATGIINVCSDVEGILVPAWAIWQLNMNFKRKASVFAVFGVGTIAVIIGIFGLYYRIRVLRHPDFTWEITHAFIFVMAEIGAVIIVSCCPYLPRFYRNLIRRQPLHSSNANSYGHGGSSGKGASIRPSRLNPFDKYRGKGVHVSGLESQDATSESHIQLHDYSHVEGVRGGSGSAEKVDFDGSGIVKTTDVVQWSSERRLQSLRSV